MGRQVFEKQDRIARLMRALQLFQSARRGLTSAELAEKMGISQRQAQRDIAVLESEEGIPFVKDGRRYSVMEGYWLPPVNFSITEAMAMVIGARLMWQYAEPRKPLRPRPHTRSSPRCCPHRCATPSSASPVPSLRRPRMVPGSRQFE